MFSIDSMNIAGIRIGSGEDAVLIAGPCVIESRDSAFQIAETLKLISERIGIPLFFKASFDKANRTSSTSFRGPGLQKGLRILEDIKIELQLPIVTDIHLPEQAQSVAGVVDIIQIPAFLSRQTDLLIAAGTTGSAVNIKKGQFIAPEDMKYAVEKVSQAGSDRILLTERGVSFGYNDLIVDYRGIRTMRNFCPVVFDATHSVQQPGKAGGASGGVRDAIPDLVLAAAAVSVDALFMEVHPDPESALSDAACMYPLDQLEKLLLRFKAVQSAVGRGGHNA